LEFGIYFLEFQEHFQLSAPSPHKKGKVSNVLKRASTEASGVVFLDQETFAFFTPGFPLQSGL